jgi:CheY-like chemotaxis protein
VARDGQGAIEMCRKAIEERRAGCGCHEPYPLVFMDNEMHPMDGNEATRKIKQLEETKYNPQFLTKVVSMSGMNCLKDIKKSKEAGMDEFVGKPPAAHLMKNVISSIFK